MFAIASARDGMSLREPKEPAEPRPMVSFRIRQSLVRYVKRMAEASERDQTEVINDAVTLDRDIEQALGEQKTRLKAFAESQGLSLGKDFGVVIARLAEIGLDTHERDSKRTTKK